MLGMRKLNVDAYVATRQLLYGTTPFDSCVLPKCNADQFVPRFASDDHMGADRAGY